MDVTVSAGLQPGSRRIGICAALTLKRNCHCCGVQIVCGPIEAAFANGGALALRRNRRSRMPSGAHTVPGVTVFLRVLQSGEQSEISAAHFIRAVTHRLRLGKSRVSIVSGGLATQRRLTAACNARHRSDVFFRGAAPHARGLMRIICAAAGTIHPKQPQPLESVPGRVARTRNTWRRLFSSREKPGGRRVLTASISAHG